MMNHPHAAEEPPFAARDALRLPAEQIHAASKDAKCFLTRHSDRKWPGRKGRRWRGGGGRGGAEGSLRAPAGLFLFSMPRRDYDS